MRVLTMVLLVALSFSAFTSEASSGTDGTPAGGHRNPLPTSGKLKNHESPITDEYGQAIAIDGSGNVHVAGYEGNNNERNFLTIKYDSSGVQQWTARYDGPFGGLDEATAIAVDQSGNVLVTGRSKGLDSPSEYVTIKYDEHGNVQWVSRYNGDADWGDIPNAIAVDASGSVYVTGSSHNTGGSTDYVTIKYSSSGVEQWVARYDGPANGNDAAAAIALDAFRNVFVTGYSTLATLDFATIKYDSSGMVQWVARYDGPAQGTDNADAISVDPAGNVYIAGTSNGINTSGDIATIKYDGSGFLQWVSRYNGPDSNSEITAGLDIDTSGSVYVTGSNYRPGTTWDIVTIKYNTAGLQQWVAEYSGPGKAYDFATSVHVDATGNVHVSGSTSGADFDYATIKYDNNGVEQWVALFDGTGEANDRLAAMAVDVAGNTFVTGTSSGTTTHLDCTTIKYRPDGLEAWVAHFGPGEPGQPSVVTLPPDSISATSAVFRALVVPDGIPRTLLFHWGPDSLETSSYRINAGEIKDGGPVEIRVRPDRLFPGRSYTFRAGLDYAGWGNAVSFVTEPDSSASGFSIPLTMVDGGGTGTTAQIRFGVHTHARYCVDLELNEFGCEPPPSVGRFHLGFTDYRGYVGECMSGGICPNDIRKYTSTAQEDTFTVLFQPSTESGYPVLFSWPALDQYYSGSVRIVDPFTWGAMINIDMKSQTTLTLGAPWERLVILASGPVSPGTVEVPPDHNGTPATFSLAQNYPNPFNAATNISFNLSEGTRVLLKVYDILGREVRTLLDGFTEAGAHSVHFDSESLSSGIYICRLLAGNREFSIRMMLLK
ncbi:MAG: SBBP repeat-containing protein [Bacteroidota bacterium]